MTAFPPIDDSMIQIADVSLLEGGRRTIADNILSLEVSLTMDGASEISFEIIDPDFLFAKSNYFQIRRDVLYQDQIFEIAVVEVGAGDSIWPVYKISARNKNVQMMKRDKSPEAYRATSASDYVKVVADRFGMGSIIEETTKKQSVVKGRSDKTDESVWDVISRSASDAQFVAFEVSNLLFFCSQQFLLGKWGDPAYVYGEASFIPFVYPEPSESVFPGAAAKYVLLEMPTFRRSDDDPMDAEGSMVVEKTNGRLLRPGMTVWVGGVPDFEGFYLITSVEFDEGTPNPVRVQFRTPIKAEEVQGSSTGDLGGGGQTGTGSTSSAGGLSLPQNIINGVREYVFKNITKLSNETNQNFSARTFSWATEAVNFADKVYKRGTATAQRQMIDEWALSFRTGRADVRWKAVNSVSNLLAERALQRTGLPSRIYDKMYLFVFQVLQVQGAGNINVILNPASEAAYNIYKATSQLAKTQLFALYKAQYGEQSQVYRTLNHVRTDIAGAVSAPLRDAFPPMNTVSTKVGKASTSAVRLS